MANAESLQLTGTRRLRILAAVCFILMGLATFAIAQAGKRLILRDGTWQGITKYEVQGDRARYFSSQRGEWEEVPKELVDWKATEEWNAGLKEKSPELRQFEAEDEAERKAEATSGTAVAPGLRLPMMGGVFVLDTFSGQPSLDELVQSESERNLATGGRNSLPVDRKATIRQQFELRGPHAHVQAHAPLPEIFVNISTADNETHALASTERFRILRLQSNEDSRVVGKVEVTLLGKQKMSQQFVPTRVESISGGWLKIIPLGALEPGEYALVEMLGPEGFNSYVWDFGVNPDAPANRNSRKPESPANE